MWNSMVSVLAGLVAWIVVVTAINWGLRLWLPGYAAAEPAMAFTLTMQIARLAMAAVTSLAAGAVVGAIAPQGRYAPWIAGGIVLLLFLPVHLQIWAKFPVWYHLTFLLTIVPLFVAGAILVPGRKGGLR